MKYCIAFVTTTVMLLSSLPVHGKEVWKIASLNWEPYAAAQMASEGNAVQKLRRLLKKEGIELVVEFYPWKRAQREAKTGDYIGYFPAWPEEVYEGFIASAPVDWSEIGILKMSFTDVKFRSVKQLFEDYTVGVVDTYTYPKDIQDEINRHKYSVSGGASDTILLKKLAAERHQVAITDPLVMTYLAHQHGIAGVEVVKVLERHPLVIAFRDEPDNLDKLALLNRLLAEQRKKAGGE